MNPEPMPKSSLHAGDILLCNIPSLSLLDYVQGITKVVAHFVRTRTFDLQAATPLIHWIIGYLDEGHYFHASFWNGSKVVESRMKNGLRANSLDTYADDIVDVYRFRKDGDWLGSPRLPAAPLLRKAQELVDRHWQYGYSSALMLAILCVSRWRRAEWVDRLRDTLARLAPSPGLAELATGLVDRFRPQIDTVIEHLFVKALEVVQSYMQGPGYVCSQAVAVIFNEAGDGAHAVGTYAISKPSHAGGGPGALARGAAPQVDESACEHEIHGLGAALARLPVPAATLLTASHLRDYDALQGRLQTDSFYTPRDLAQSGRTVLVGRLDLAMRAKAPPRQNGASRTEQGAGG